MTQPDRDNQKEAGHLRRADDMQQTLEQTMQDEHDAITLLEKLDRLAVDLHELAEAWEPIDLQMAARVRGQETQIYELRARVARLAEAEAEDSANLIQEIKTVLRQARES